VSNGSHWFLKTFGTPALFREPGAVPTPLRNKDLALLIYLRLEGGQCLSRSPLASMLWGDSTEQKARHSLSQALGRLQSLLGSSALFLARDTIVWRGQLPCDAALLDEGPTAADDDRFYLRFYTGDFVAGPGLGPGATDFELWAEAKRASYRLKAVRALDQRAAEAECSGAFSDALHLALRAVEIEPLLLAGHRRIMRAWRALGEHALAMKHYQAVAHLLSTTTGVGPDALTRALADELATTGGYGAALRAVPVAPTRASG